MAGEADAFLLLFLAFIFPPAAVAFVAGCGADLCLNILLTLLGYLPGMIHAFWLVLKRTEANERYGYKNWVYTGMGEYLPADGRPPMGGQPVSYGPSQGVPPPPPPPGQYPPGKGPQPSQAPVDQKQGVYAAPPPAGYQVPPSQAPGYMPQPAPGYQAQQPQPQPQTQAPPVDQKAGGDMPPPPEKYGYQVPASDQKASADQKPGESTAQSIAPTSATAPPSGI